MHLHPSDIATIALALIAFTGLVVGCIAWFFKRGGDERVYASALADNTEAIRDLTREFREHKEIVGERLHDLDKRVALLEKAPTPVHVTTTIEAPIDSASTHRDAGTPG